MDRWITLLRESRQLDPDDWASCSYVFGLYIKAGPARPAAFPGLTEGAF